MDIIEKQKFKTEAKTEIQEMIHNIVASHKYQLNLDEIASIIQSIIGQMIIDEQVLTENRLNRKEHSGYFVDLSITETIKLIKEVKFIQVGEFWRFRYRGELLKLCRTDLKDNVCTGSTDIKNPRVWAIENCKYGARILHSDNLFAIVNTYSDG